MHYACRSLEGPFCGDNPWHKVGPYALPPRIPHWLRPPTEPASALLLTISWLCFLSNWPDATIFFLMAHSLAPYSTGTANCGTWPLSMTLTRSVKADRKRDPASAEPWATNERSWPGRRPSGPPEAPAWKDKIPFRTSSSEATAGTTGPSVGSGRLRFSVAEGCFSFKALA